MIPAFVNPDARSGDQVDQALKKSGVFDVRLMKPPQMREAAHAAIQAGAKRIAAAGGDGTVSAVAAAVVNTDVELLVIPAGTRNHFARAHGIPLDLDTACGLARDGRIELVDVAWVNDRLFLNTSSVGVYANFVRVREGWERWCGYWLASLLSMVRTFVRVRPFDLWFETDGLERRYSTPQLFIGVGERELKLPKLGGRVERGRPGLHVMIVRGRTRSRLVALAFAAAARGVRAMSRTPHLDAFLLKDFSVEQRHSTVAVDGEVVTLRSPLRYQLGHRALRLVVPR